MATLTTESKYWFFKHFFFFDLIDDDEYKELDVQSEFVQCQKDGFVYLSGDQEDSVFFLKQGYIKLGTYDDQGKEIILNVLQPGDIFGSIAHGQRRGVPTEFAQAISEASVCKINTERFQQMLATRPDLTVQVMKTMGDRIHKMERKLVSLAFKDARTRVIDFLKDFATEYGRVRGAEIHIENFLTHQDMASLTATSRQLVSTLLNELREAGDIEYDRKVIIVKKPIEELK